MKNEHSTPRSEEELLAAIERGDALPGRLGEMSRDRKALVSTDPGPAPRWLLGAAIDEALGEVSGETLRLLGEGEPGGPPAAPGRRPRRRRPVPLWPALAAAVVLLVGGIAGLNIRRWLTLAPAAPAAQPGREAAAPVENPADRPGADQTRITSAPPHRVPNAAQDTPGVIELGETVTLADAADLLAGGRLAVLARGGSAGTVRTGLRAMTARGGDRSWSLAAGVPSLGRLDLPEPGRLIFASAGGEPGGELIHPERTAWTARLDSTATSLGAMVHALEALGLDVELRRLSGPLPIDPAADADDVLWWSRPPTVWRKPAAAAVIVESLPGP